MKVSGELTRPLNPKSIPVALAPVALIVASASISTSLAEVQVRFERLTVLFVPVMVVTDPTVSAALPEAPSSSPASSPLPAPSPDACAAACGSAALALATISPLAEAPAARASPAVAPHSADMPAATASTEAVASAGDPALPSDGA